VVTLIIIVITFIGTIGEQEDKSFRANMGAICIAAILGFIAVTWFL